MQNYARGIVSDVKRPTFGILGPLYISGKVEVRNFKFSMPMQNTIPMTISRSV